MPIRFLSNTSITPDGMPVETSQQWGKEYVVELLRILAKIELKNTEDFGSYLDEIYDKVTSTDVAIVTAYLSQKIMDFVRQKDADGIHVRVFVLGYITSQQIPEDCEIYCLRDHFREEAGFHEEQTT